jgi:hypothetical protein
MRAPVYRRLAQTRRPYVLRACRPRADFREALGFSNSALGRMAFEQALDFDPLHDCDVSTVSLAVAIPCGPGDVEILPLVLAGLRRGIAGPVRKVEVVAPAAVLAALHDRLDQSDHAVIVREEETLLPPLVVDALYSYGGGRSTPWLLQQAIKLMMVLGSDQPAVLVLDADTVLLQPRTWVCGTRQVLAVVHEFHEPYDQHFRFLFGDIDHGRRVSFVAHHQLMQPHLVREMMSEIDTDPIEALAIWIRSARRDCASPVSEYHTYGRWLWERHPECTALARWGNMPVPRPRLSRTVGNRSGPAALDAISRTFRGVGSVSSHRYLT